MDPILVQILASQEEACDEITLLLDKLVCSRIYQCQILYWVRKDRHIMPPNYYGVRAQKTQFKVFLGYLRLTMEAVLKLF